MLQGEEACKKHAGKYHSNFRMEKSPAWRKRNLQHLSGFIVVDNLNLFVPSELWGNPNILIPAVLTLSSSILNTWKVTRQQRPGPSHKRSTRVLSLVWIFFSYLCFPRLQRRRDLQTTPPLPFLLLSLFPPLSLISICYAFSIEGERKTAWLCLPSTK